MTSPITKTPRAHHIFNALDEHGVVLGLERLHEEHNAAYKRRLLDVMVHRAGSTYAGLLHGITRELGLSIYEVMTITCKTDDDGVFLLPNPAVIFSGNLCSLVSNANANEFETLVDIDRYDPRGVAWTLQGLVETINATGYFEATLTSGIDPYRRSMEIYDQATAQTVSSESIASAANRIKLANEHIITGSLAMYSPNLTEQVLSEIELVRAGQYYVDYESGLILCTESPVDGSVVRYLAINSPARLFASPVILHNLQQDPFRKKLFERVYDDLGDEYDGPLSLKGADIINELYSMSPMFWGV